MLTTQPVYRPATTQSTPAAQSSEEVSNDQHLMDLAIELEASFLAEMLRSAGLGATRDAFGGGAGEEQFTSMLRKAQADEIAQNGGVGLAEHIFEALKERSNGAS